MSLRPLLCLFFVLFLIPNAQGQVEEDAAPSKKAKRPVSEKRTSVGSKSNVGGDDDADEKQAWVWESLRNSYLQRTSILYQGSEVAMLHPPLDTYAPKGVMVEWDFLFFHIGLNHQFDQDIPIGGVRYEAYLSNLDVGVRLHAPFRFIQPFIGLGGHLGWMAVSSPSYRRENGILAHWEGGRSGTWGTYFEAGLDLIIPVSRNFVNPLFGRSRLGNLAVRV